MTVSAVTSDQITAIADKFHNAQLKLKGAAAFFHRNVTVRAGHMVGLISAPFSSTLDLLIGILASIGSLLTFTLIKPLNKRASDLTLSGGFIIIRIFRSLILSINPSAELGDKLSGPVYRALAKPIKQQAKEWAKSYDSTIKKHVFSRLAFFGYMLTCLVTRTIDFVIGIFAAIVSILTLGKIKTVNSLACSSLTSLRVINDVYTGFAKTINPRAFKSY